MSCSKSASRCSTRAAFVCLSCRTLFFCQFVTRPWSPRDLPAVQAFDLAVLHDGLSVDSKTFDGIVTCPVVLTYLGGVIAILKSLPQVVPSYSLRQRVARLALYKANYDLLAPASTSYES
jgi:hypothetical protein